MTRSEGAIFGLLGLILAFLFSGALTRFDAARHLVVEEANDIGTAWLRIALLPAGAAAAVLILAIIFLSVRYLIPEKARGQAKSLVWPDKALLRLAAFAFLALFSEGIMADWSGVYLPTVIGVQASTAALGFAAYSFAMAGGRFLGDRLFSALGPILLLRFSGLLTAVGLTLALLIRTPEVVIVGFILVGLGLSNLVPIFFGSAGRHKAGVGPGIAAVTTIGFFGFLVGPPLNSGLSLEPAGSVVAGYRFWIDNRKKCPACSCGSVAES